MRSKTRRGASLLAALVAFGLVLTGCSAGSSAGVTLPDQVDGELPSDTVAQLQGAVEHAMQASGSTGAIAGVWVPWSGTWIAGLGTTGPESDEAVTTDMSFRVAEVTRAMTCDLLYELADRNVVDLDDPVARHVPSVPKLTDITLVQLCDSTSGLGSFEPTAASAWFNTPAREWNPRELASYGLAQERSAAGAAFRDSDTGYMLLGQALENATGRSASELMRQYVFEPAELEQTALPGARAATPGSTYLPGYQSLQADLEAGCVAPTDYSEFSASIGYTNAGAVATIDDLGRYGQILAARSIAEEDNGRFGHNLPVDPSRDSWFLYGGGAYQAGSLLGQQGSVPGYAVSVWADPATGMAVAVVLNNSAAGADIAGVLGRELAAIASKAPAAEGQSQPEFGLPWTVESMHQQVADRAVCPIAQ